MLKFALFGGIDRHLAILHQQVLDPLIESRLIVALSRRRKHGPEARLARVTSPKVMCVCKNLETISSYVAVRIRYARANRHVALVAFVICGAALVDPVLGGRVRVSHAERWHVWDGIAPVRDPINFHL